MLGPLGSSGGSPTCWLCYRHPGPRDRVRRFSWDRCPAAKRTVGDKQNGNKGDYRGSAGEPEYLPNGQGEGIMDAGHQAGYRRLQLRR